MTTLTRRRQVVNYAAGEVEPQIGSFATARCFATGEQDALTVLTFNIQFGMDAGRAGAELAAAARFRRPDVILLQEMDPAGTASIARDLGFHYVYAPAVVHSRHGRPFGQAVLSPWPLRDAQIVNLPHVHPLNGQRRIALMVTAEVDGRDVRACSVHTETALLPAGCRRDQVAAALDALADWDGPVVVGGDFNTVTRASVRDLAAVGERAGFERVGGYAPTVDVNAGRVRLASLTLDHVLHRGLEARASAVTRQTRCSDHRPVWASFLLPPRPALAQAV